jgi:hypothetical protein
MLTTVWLYNLVEVANFLKITAIRIGGPRASDELAFISKAGHKSLLHIVATTSWTK